MSAYLQQQNPWGFLSKFRLKQGKNSLEADQSSASLELQVARMNS